MCCEEALGELQSVHVGGGAWRRSARRKPCRLPSLLHAQGTSADAAAAILKKEKKNKLPIVNGAGELVSKRALIRPAFPCRVVRPGGYFTRRQLRGTAAAQHGSCAAQQPHEAGSLRGCLRVSSIISRHDKGRGHTCSQVC